MQLRREWGKRKSKGEKDERTCGKSRRDCPIIKNGIPNQRREPRGSAKKHLSWYGREEVGGRDRKREKRFIKSEKNSWEVPKRDHRRPLSGVQGREGPKAHTAALMHSGEEEPRLN